MVRAGFKTFFLGFESSDYQWQRKTGGKVYSEEFGAAVRVLREAGAPSITAYIIIGHPSGYETWYAHLDGFDVEKGSHVNRGQVIAEMGSTGFSTGSHLHFEVREDGQIVDPLEFLSEASLKPAVW